MTFDTKLRVNWLCMLYEQYPEFEWTRVYTDFRLWYKRQYLNRYVCSKFPPISICGKLGQISSRDLCHFIGTRKSQVKDQCFSKAVILVYPKAAIQTYYKSMHTSWDHIGLKKPLTFSGIAINLQFSNGFLYIW